MNEIGLLRKNIATLLRRSAVDEEFRRLCLEDAGAAYWQLTGQSLPERYLVRFADPDPELPVDGADGAGGEAAARIVRLPRLLPKTWLG